MLLATSSVSTPSVMNLDNPTLIIEAYSVIEAVVCTRLQHVPFVFIMEFIFVHIVMSQCGKDIPGVSNKICVGTW